MIWARRMGIALAHRVRDRPFLANCHEPSLWPTRAAATSQLILPDYPLREECRDLGVHLVPTSLQIDHVRRAADLHISFS